MFRAWLVTLGPGRSLKRRANSRASCPTMFETRRIRHPGVVPAMKFIHPSFVSVALGCGLYFLPAAGLQAQQSSSPTAQAQPATGQGQEPDPLKRERSDKEKFEAQKAVRQELKGAYKTWLEQDVTYIISDDERKAFKNLSN